MATRAPQTGVGELEGQTASEGSAVRSGPPRPQAVVGAAGREAGARQKSLTIGAVCKALAQEFPDISISKIRYLEDQKLLTPRRTPGGYRLYTQGDVARLRTILRMQRDEFLPLRVIRQELAAGRSPEAPPVPGRVRREAARGWRPSVSVRQGSGALYSMDDVLEETKADAKL